MKYVVVYLSLLVVIGFFNNVWTQTVTPNFVKTEVYLNNDSVSISITYFDGQERELQTGLYLDVDKTQVVSTIYDDVGRPEKTTVPFIKSSMDFVLDPIAAAQTDRGDNYSFRESRYKPDPLDRTDAVGTPGQAYSLDGAHYGRAWSFGTARTGSDETIIDKWGLIFENKLSNSLLDGFEATGITSSNTSYFLTVSKGPNDNSYTQEIKDVFGRTLSKCNMLGIRSEYSYDIFGNVLMEIPPDSNTDPSADRLYDVSKATTYVYNTAGQLLSKRTVDGGLVESKYDLAGRMIASQNAKQRSTTGGCDYTVYLYDAFGRNFAVGINTTPTTFTNLDADNATFTLTDLDIRLRMIYDDPAVLQTVLGATYTPGYFSTNFCSIENTQGRLVAEIAYSEGIRNVPFFQKTTIVVFSYDDDGNICARLERIPGMTDFCMFTYNYDQQGNLTSYRYAKNENKIDPMMDNMKYSQDRHGRLMAIRSTNSQSQTNPLVHNFYNHYGLLSRKVFGYSTDYSSYIDDMLYYYDLRNWPTGTANSKFMELNICYNTSTIAGTSLLQPQFNGNISAIQYRYNVPGVYEFGIDQFEYDNANRMTNVYPTNVAFSAQEKFIFNRDGTIAGKQRIAGPSGAPLFNGLYRYIPNTNRLHAVENYMPKANSNNYIYDPNGNLVFDYSKKMFIEYDWRNKPITFKFFNVIPSTVLQAADETARGNLWRTLKQNIEASGATLVSEVKMVYDAGGARVIKNEYKF